MSGAGDGALRAVISPAGHLGPFRAAVTERTGGVSPVPFSSLNAGRSTPDDPAKVRANERIILRSLGLEDRVARLRLEHGNRVLRPAGPGFHGPGDALLSDDPDLVLWFTVADCVPLTLAAGAWRAHGHCGWRGTASGLVEAMVEAMARIGGADPASLRAWTGPGIGPCCFEVGPEVAAKFDPASIRHAAAAFGQSEARSFLDLPAEIGRRLRRLGLAPDAIAGDSSCTCCEPARFFSHRRDGVPTGRLAALSWSDARSDQARSPDAPTTSR